VSLHKILSVSCEKAQFHKVFARALLDSLVTRLRGLLDAIRITTPDPQCDRTQPYGQFIYIMAAVLDPGYNFIWLDRDHPASPEVKARTENLDYM